MVRAPKLLLQFKLHVRTGYPEKRVLQKSLECVGTFQSITLEVPIISITSSPHRLNNTYKTILGNPLKFPTSVKAQPIEIERSVYHVASSMSRLHTGNYTQVRESL